MANTLIRLADGVLVEVEKVGDYRLVASGAETVAGSLDVLAPVIRKVAKALQAVYAELEASDVYAEAAEVELSIGFEAEGNVFLAKSKTSGAIAVKIQFKRQK